MLTISIPTKSKVPKECGGRSIPKAEGVNYIFDVTDEEYMFWNSLTPVEKDGLADSTASRCFFDVLHESMREKRPDNYTKETEQWIELKS